MKLSAMLFVVVWIVPLHVPYALEKKGDSACIEKLTISRNESPWRGASSLQDVDPDTGVVRAVRMDAKYYKTPVHLSRFEIRGETLIGIDAKKKSVSVNKKYFSDLSRADATRLAANESKLLGRWQDLTFTAMSPRSVVLFLLKSQIINTYWHLESNLCLTQEKDDAGEYTASFDGHHSYCTNECIDEPLRFSVRIDKETGEIFVCGSPAP